MQIYAYMSIHKEISKSKLIFFFFSSGLHFPLLVLYISVKSKKF